MIKQIAHICIHTADLEATERFYRDGLGFERHFTFAKDDGCFGFYLRAGNATFIEVFKGEPGQTGNIHHVAFEVHDMDAVLARLDSLRIAHTAKTLGADNSWQSWIEDPNGVRIELHEYTAGSSQLTRKTCTVNW